VPHSFDTLNKMEVIKNIVNANEKLKNIYANNTDSIHFLFSYDVNNGKTIVLKCSPQIRETLKEMNDKIKIGFKICPIYDKHHVFQCSNCCQFGHSAKFCKNNETFCTFCSEKHNFKDCPNKNNADSFKCINCLQSDNKVFNESADSHNAFSSQCPVKSSKFKSYSNSNIKPNT